MSQKLGLRERKKQQTRDALLESAMKLFTEKGYRATSIEEITGNANYAQRTFFLHFSSKEDILFPHNKELIEDLKDVFMNRGDTPALGAFKQWQLEAVVPKLTAYREYDEMSRQLMAKSESLRARQKMEIDKIEDLLALELAKDRGSDPTDLTSRVIAATTIAIFTVLYRYGMSELSREEIIAAIDESILFIKNDLVTHALN